VPWFASLIGFKEVAHIKMTGSGDTTFDYFMVLFFICFSIVLAPIIYLIGKNINYTKSTQWLLIIIRYFLAYNMIIYGFAKLFCLQFSSISEYALDNTYGNGSPMGLLWNFMGYSQGYTMFTGFLEFIAGLFLFSRRTQTLGALTTFGVMLNVFMLNMCYDVPVKLLSGHIVLLSLILITFDGSRIWNFFFGNRGTSPQSIPDVIPEKYQKIKTILKWTVLLGFLGYSTYSSMESYKTYGPKAKKPKLAGAYKVNSFKVFQDGKEVNPVPYSKKWEAAYKIYQGSFIVKLKDGAKGYACELDTTEQILNLKNWGDSIYQKIHYSHLPEKGLYLQGHLYEDSIDVVLTFKSREDFPLLKREFHWIQEYPYNR